MLVACFLSYLVYTTVQCQSLVPAHQDDSHKPVQCITNILHKYFIEHKELTYVNMNSEDDTILESIHSTMNFSLITRESTHQMFIPNKSYFISSADAAQFTEYFGYLIREPTWNPYARFLIIIKWIKVIELKLIFNELLRQHVVNILVINGTDGHLYTYNPFENYACGRYYDNVISYGLCNQTNENEEQTNHNLYPDKLVTGLRNCHFKASLAHRPPYSMDPTKTAEKKPLLGTEEYIIKLLGEAEQFTVNFNYSYNGDLFSTVQKNMTAIGPMSMLQKNECDIIFGGMMMVTTRAEAFTYLCGYHDYNDELRFAVKTSSLVPTWKYIYLEFDLEVWILLLVTCIIFYVFVIIVLRSKDSGEIALRLLDNLLVHDRSMRSRFKVKCIFIMWVWFAYLINTFYQSSLFSFTTNPIVDFQVSDENDMKKYNFQPCFSLALRNYISSETNRLSNYAYYRDEGCLTVNEAMDTVSSTKDMFTLVPNYYYMYNQRKYNDKWGKSLIYYFHKPYTKFLYGYFFYKGFPVTHRLRLNALRMRESGLTDKNLQDHYYLRRIKQRFSQKTFETRFLFPWYLCVVGLIVATVTFIIELIIHRLKWSNFQNTLVNNEV